MILNSLVENNRFLDYWFEYDRYIPFPKQLNTIRKIDNFEFLTYSKSNTLTDIQFFINYSGSNVDLLNSFKNCLSNKHYIISHEFQGKQWKLIRKVNLIEQKAIYMSYNDVIKTIEYLFSNDRSYFSGIVKEKSLLTNEFLSFKKKLKDESVIFRNIKKNEFENIFGISLKEYIENCENESLRYKEIAFTTLVGEVYSAINNIKESCEEMLVGLQNGKNSYTLEQYKRFKKTTENFNVWLGQKNETTKKQIKSGLIKNQTLMMFLRNNSKKNKK